MALLFLSGEPPLSAFSPHIEAGLFGGGVSLCGPILLGAVESRFDNLIPAHTYVTGAFA